MQELTANYPKTNDQKLFVNQQIRQSAKSTIVYINTGFKKLPLSKMYCGRPSTCPIQRFHDVISLLYCYYYLSLCL